MPDPSPKPSPARIRCRQITEADLDAIVALLTKGFSERTAAYWRQGLARHKARDLPPDCPTYGYMLEGGGRPVGVLLTLYSVRTRGGRDVLWCNLSSWYVEPEFRAQASMLDAMAQRRKDVTYCNVTPAPHTYALQEARGFKHLCQGQILAVPALSRVPEGVTARLVTPEDPLSDLSPNDAVLVRDHAHYGCICFVGTRAGKSQPFIFVRRKIGPFRRKTRGNLLPCFQLIYCHDTAELPVFAGALGRRMLLGYGIPWIMLDGVAPMKGLFGSFFKGRAPKFTRGPNPVRLGDLAYTEIVIFGP